MTILGAMLFAQAAMAKSAEEIRCANSSFRRECVVASEVATRSRTLVMLCNRRPDPVRERQLHPHGPSTSVDPAAIQTLCADVQAACIANWRALYERMRFRGDEARVSLTLTSDYIDERARAECELDTDPVQH